MDLSTKFVAYGGLILAVLGLNLCASNILEYKIITER